MDNDTTRMKKLADELSAVTIPSCKHMEREEYRDCVLQMLEDLEQLGRRDGCIAAAWALDALPSLQRELAEAVPFMAALKGRHNGYDPGNAKMYPDGPPATPEVALNELIEEQEWLVNSELQQAQSDAERLRKAIETHRLEWGAGRVIESNNRLWSALSPSPAAASGDWLNKMADAEDAAGDISIGTSAPAAESDKPCGLVEQMDAGEGTVYGRRVTVKRREYPAAETQGNAQHHIEGAKIPEVGSGSSSAESEGGEPIIKVERVGELSTPELEQWQRQCRQNMVDEKNRYKAECKALSDRLAACEERCKELEAGIEKHESRMNDSGHRPQDYDRALWSLLATKAGGAG